MAALLRDSLLTNGGVVVESSGLNQYLVKQTVGHAMEEYIHGKKKVSNGFTNSVQTSGCSAIA